MRESSRLGLTSGRITDVYSDVMMWLLNVEKSR